MVTANHHAALRLRMSGANLHTPLGLSVLHKEELTFAFNTFYIVYKLVALSQGDSQDLQKCSCVIIFRI